MKKLLSHNPFDGLGKKLGMDSHKEEIHEELGGNNAQNFSVYLHKRERFYRQDVKINGGTLKNHEQYAIKKIYVDSVEIYIDNKQRERNREIEILNEFTAWQPASFYRNFAQRHKANAQALCSGLKTLELKPEWKLAIGLGGGSIFETAISLHHIHGFPYIPASSIKGALRTFVINTIFGTQENCPKDESEYPLENAEHRALTSSEGFCELFGCPKESNPIEFSQGKPITQKNKKGEYEHKKGNAVGCAKKDEDNKSTEYQGCILFFDAYPVESLLDASGKNKIKKDIMNPHYPDYYNDKAFEKPPTDTQSPKPIVFLVVENLKFQFMVGLRKGYISREIIIGNEKKQYKGQILDVIYEILKEALTTHGIGAKTSVGYGYFK